MKYTLTLIITLYLSVCQTLEAQNQTDTTVLKKHLTAITKTDGYRNYQNLKVLNQVAGYIFKEFQLYADTVYEQPFQVNGNTYKNVICAFGPKTAKTVVVGAHYDVCHEQEGADDNASGVVALLELARQLKDKPLNYRIELVAYTLEEPPYFRTRNMGSYIHAKSLIEKKTDVYGMISVEMIGYFREEKHTQRYPIFFLSWIYGNKGDYITLVNKFRKGGFAQTFTHKMMKNASMKTKKFTGPKMLLGIDFSDHLNYWKMGISALMITDTAFYRNHFYHQKGDKMERLNLDKMAKIVDDLLKNLVELK